MFYTLKLKKTVLFSILGACLLAAFLAPWTSRARPVSAPPEKKEFIHWVDFTIPPSLMEEAAELDVKTHEDPEAIHISWVDSLAYLGAKCGGDFSQVDGENLKALAQKVENGETVAALGEDLPHFSYYREAYGAVLEGFLGSYEIETETGWEKRYGLKAYSPIAKTFPYSDYDDFGAGRSYGFRRKHLGHDMMAAVGTPVIAVESGVVEALGWNQYGGWRVGIRSFDGRRYHYYAHLRKDRPYAQGLEIGNVVMAGDVIGYVGRTGYSANENVNNIDVSHLHYGLQLIFDESQKEGNNEIWIDVYGLCRLLRNRQSETCRDDATKEWARVWGYREAVPQNRFQPAQTFSSPAP